MEREAKLIEDNGGGLHLLLIEGGRCVAAASGLEHAGEGEMLVDLCAAMRVGELLGEWSGRAEDPQALHDELVAELDGEGSGAIRLVVEATRGAAGPAVNVELHIDAMGVAAKRYAGLSGLD